MKNKKVILFLAITALLAGGPIQSCVKKNVKHAEKRTEKRALKNFQNYILENANGEVMAGMNTSLHEYAGYDDRKLELWIDLFSGDSALYANALKRDAHLIYDKNLGDSLSLAKIHNAPTYTRGPGTEYDEAGNAVYNENSIKCVNQLHNMEVNYNNYKDRVRELYKMRAEMMARINKR